MDDDLSNHRLKLMMVGVGMVLLAASHATSNESAFIVSLVPLSIGIGQLVRYWGENRAN